MSPSPASETGSSGHSLRLRSVQSTTGHFVGDAEGSRNLEESYPLLYISEKHKELVHPRTHKSKAKQEDTEFVNSK